MKKLLIGFGVVVVAVATLPLFAAFEAHVINVTAKIENALNVPIKSIEFGTVFPQEHLDQPLNISLSDSFLAESRVDDVNYVIRQKPKCGITTTNGTVLVKDSTVTGHVFPGIAPTDATHTYSQQNGYYVDCGVTPRVVEGQTFGMLPLLCPYISKHPDGTPANDDSLNSFHQPFTIVDTQTGPVVQWNDTKGHLAKSEQDTVDNWKIDLAVPCFGGQCAQDWASFVHSFNRDANPADYVQPTSNEHKVFGCDLWVEVGGISLPGLGCKGKIDLMMVVDRSGSIGTTNMNIVKNALTTFVNALMLGPDASHAGQSSFAYVGTLDQPLTGSSTLVISAINGLFSSGTTNLSDGIDKARDEFASIRNRGDAPDYMVIVTDGEPNTGAADPFAAAKASADAAKAAGIQIYVVGIGTTPTTSAWLKANIASGPTYYFDATDFNALQQSLVDIVTCKPAN